MEFFINKKIIKKIKKRFNLTQIDYQNFNKNCVYNLESNERSNFYRFIFEFSNNKLKISYLDYFTLDFSTKNSNLDGDFIQEIDLRKNDINEIINFLESYLLMRKLII